jgi:hypothetical protein
MTDGIIQKVFKKYHTGGFEVTIDDEIDVMVMPTRYFDNAFKELIEEIKKSHNNGGCDITCGNTKDCRFIEELIGDNE